MAADCLLLANLANLAGIPARLVARTQAGTVLRSE
jgi:transglutaminase-like putative cysteine protease